MQQIYMDIQEFLLSPIDKTAYSTVDETPLHLLIE
jgi:hypothetical protein